MKFPIDIDTFIAVQEELLGEKVTDATREICEEAVRACNSVYRNTLCGKVTENPFSGDVSERVKELNDRDGVTDDPDTLASIIEIMTVLFSWGTLAYEQGLQDMRKEATA